jgi:ribosome recycling factor
MTNVTDVKKSAEQKMHKSLEALRVDLAKVRTGRAHSGLLDHVMVDYYGSQTPIPKVANVTVIDARTIGVSPWEKKMVGAIEKAIRESDLGLNPASQGDMVRVPMPALTEERRRDLIKVIKHDGENAKVAIRNQRRESCPEGTAEEQGGVRGRRAARAGRGAKAHRPAHRGHRQDAGGERSGVDGGLIESGHGP